MRYYEETVDNIKYIIFKSLKKLEENREKLASLSKELSWDNHAKKVREELERVGLL